MHLNQIFANLEGKNASHFLDKYDNSGYSVPILRADEHFASKHTLLFGNTLHC